VLTGSDGSVPQGPNRPDDSPTGMPDGTYYAWAMIDPGSQVFRATESASTSFGYSHHSYGWFNQCLVAYLDGGRVPIVAGNPPRMMTQRLYYPRQIGNLWQPSTAYAVGDLVTNGVNVYRCTVAGTSAATGGPTATGTAPITDGTVSWVFVI